LGLDAVRWQGATLLRAHAREEEQRRQARAIVEAPLRQIEDAWNRHFGG
jgi:hypothetical protein